MQAHQQQAPTIGLALSGGGTRAAVFHLGVLKRLASAGLFENIAKISLAATQNTPFAATAKCSIERVSALVVQDMQVTGCATKLPPATGWYVPIGDVRSFEIDGGKLPDKRPIFVRC